MTMLASERAGTIRSGSSPATQFLGPRYWPAWLLLAWLKLVSLFPLHISIRLHKILGRVLWKVVRKRHTIVARNLELCFPNMHHIDRRLLERQHFENLLACVAELGTAWFGDVGRVAATSRIEGLEHLNAALSAGKGVILFSGHFTTLEICAPMIKAFVPCFAFMFSRRRNGLLNEFQLRGRRRAAHVSFPSDDVRAMLHTLSENGVVWYAPDRARGSACKPVQFFGQTAMMSTATSRLSRLSGAAVIPFFFRRLDDDSGYVLRLEAPLEDLPSQDPIHDTQRLTRVLERFIEESPAQYFWTQRKFEPPSQAGPRPGGGSRTVSAGESVPPVSAYRNWALALVLLGVPLFITAFDNSALWQNVMRVTLLDKHQLGILASVFSIEFLTLAVVLALVPGRRALKVVASVLLIVAAVCGFFMSTYGTLIDTSMIRNVMETELREAPLLTQAFYWHLLGFGIAPLVLVAFAPLRNVSWRRALATRSSVVALGTAALLATLSLNFGPLAFFSQRYAQVRLLLNPGYPIYSSLSDLIRDDNPAAVEKTLLEGRAAMDFASHERRTLLIFVMGEAARADRFEYNGYQRPTNPYTRSLDLVNYPNVRACDTSTADSLPCIFSELGRPQFSHNAVAQRESVFGALGRLGVEVFWRDNSTGCKDVCDPEHFEQLADHEDPELCDRSGCFDEILLKDLDALVADTSRDHFIVLHQRGSNGPAYHTDVPAALKRFLPECDLPTIRDCTVADIDNAYDNTIAYTDYFLSRVIDYLLSHSSDYDVAMLYVSDHGESLGENGLYLHGFPYAIAPLEQTRVPMLFWASYPFLVNHALDPACLHATSRMPRDHDSIFHTLLPIFGLDAQAYREELDLFAPCRGPAGALVSHAATRFE